MGGHGGLNILPQKRWNVYGRENRLKVKRDEAQADAEQAQKDALHQKAESQFRHSLLLKRATARQGATERSDDGDGTEWPALPEGEAVQALPGPESEEAELTKRTAIVPKQKPNAQNFDFLGFLNSDSGQHPEVEAEKRKELARRGEEKTQTSDAKFDAQFRFGNGLTGEKAQPWYATAPGEPSDLMTHRDDPDALATREAILNSAEKAMIKDAKKQEKLGKKEKKHRKEKKQKKDGRIDTKKSAGKDREKKQKQHLMTILRAERQAREMQEKEKAKQAIREAHFGATGEPEGKRYHGGYLSNKRR